MQIMGREAQSPSYPEICSRVPRLSPVLILKLSNTEGHRSCEQKQTYENHWHSTPCEPLDLGPCKIITKQARGTGNRVVYRKETARNGRVTMRLDHLEGKATAEEGTPRGHGGSPGREPL